MERGKDVVIESSTRVWHVPVHTYRSSSTSPPFKKPIRSTKLHTYCAVLHTLCPAVDHLHQQHHHHKRENPLGFFFFFSYFILCTTTPFKDFYLSLVRKPASFLFSLLLEIRAIFCFYSCMGPEIIMYQMVWLVVCFSYSLLTALNQPDYLFQFRI